MQTLQACIQMAIGDCSRNEFSKKAGISAGNLSKIMHGQRPSPEVLKKIAQASCGRVTYEALLAAAGYVELPRQKEERNEQHRGIPIYGSIAAGSPIEALEDLQGSIELKGDFARVGEGSFALKVVGDSMDMANIPDGSVVVIRPQSTIGQGEIGAVQVNGEVTIKRVYSQGEQLTLLPVSHNPIHQPQIYTKEDDIRILGKVVLALVDID